nr:hypothetical protein [Bacillus sp. FJAT-28004]
MYTDHHWIFQHQKETYLMMENGVISVGILTVIFIVTGYFEAILELL